MKNKSNIAICYIRVRRESNEENLVEAGKYLKRLTAYCQINNLISGPLVIDKHLPVCCCTGSLIADVMSQLIHNYDYAGHLVCLNKESLACNLRDYQEISKAIANEGINLHLVEK